MTATTGAKRSPGCSARKAASASSRTCAVYGAIVVALLLKGGTPWVAGGPPATPGGQSSWRSGAVPRPETSRRTGGTVLAHEHGHGPRHPVAPAGRGRRAGRAVAARAVAAPAGGFARAGPALSPVHGHGDLRPVRLDGVGAGA